MNKILEAERYEVREELGELMTVDRVEEFISEMEEARKEGNYEKADEIKKTLLNNNIIIKDTPEGVAWRLNKEEV